MFSSMYSLTMLLNASVFKKPFTNSFEIKDDVLATGLYKYENRHRSCSLATATGYRISGRWVTWRAFTNHHVNEQMGPKQRVLPSEGLYPDGKDTIRAQPVTIPVCSRTTARCMTPVLSKWDGKYTWSDFRNAKVQENPAMVAALENGEHEMQLALNSSTASNTAILLLPTLLAAVPLALFADVSGPIAIAYAIVTDVVSVLPLLIKGIEMIVFGRKERYAAQAMVYGAMNKRDIGLTEFWVAKCRIHSLVSRNGAILVSVAVVCMLLGITLEVRQRSSGEAQGCSVLRTPGNLSRSQSHSIMYTLGLHVYSVSRRTRVASTSFPSFPRYLSRAPDAHQ